MKPIKISLDVTKLKKEHFITGKKGTYVKLSIIETDNEHSTHIVFQDMGKDNSGEYIKGEIVGSAKRWDDTANSAASDTANSEDPLPF